MNILERELFRFKLILLIMVIIDVLLLLWLFGFIRANIGDLARINEILLGNSGEIDGSAYSRGAILIFLIGVYILSHIAILKKIKYLKQHIK